MLLGFSTGAVFRKIPSVSKEIIDICREIGCNAIELNVKTQKELEALDGLIKSSVKLNDFEYVSVHSCFDAQYMKDTKHRKVLEGLQKAYDHFNCRHCVVHPTEVEDWEVFREFNFQIAVENMSKDIAPLYLPDQLRNIFEKNKNFSMTFDVKHAFESDSGKNNLAQKLYDNFKDRIAEIHLSGYNPQATKHEHRPLAETKQNEIIEFVKDKQHIPMIIESDCEDVAQMKAEYEYIKNLLTT